MRVPAPARCSPSCSQPYPCGVRIVAEERVREYLVRQGGVVTVAARSQRCCTGAMTTLAVTIAAPPDPSRFERFEDHGVVVYYRSRAAPTPTNSSSS